MAKKNKEKLNGYSFHELALERKNDAFFGKGPRLQGHVVNIN
jgi:hypothetical protein